ncbi:Reverse transcriptases (RTs) from retrotransposons domain-containing protein [Elysia marginata]|uniref:Reverse transcriptases (RTs) from retrotransposons domain-containing protein n=1 Tax=Elysia marginata TaxID=1093978 RepID=A0AAV4GAC3_9GAST|nr:Reverse transcriptases (RTs) from retrotransposons domain-containing protein [Elysia marginata]
MRRSITYRESWQTQCQPPKLLEKVGKLNASHPSGIEKIAQEYADAFDDLGCKDETYSIRLDGKVKLAVAAASRISLILRGQLVKEPNCMESLGVIAEVGEPTDWKNPLIVVPLPIKVQYIPYGLHYKYCTLIGKDRKKPNGSLRLRMDPKRLNEAIKREQYQLPTLDEVIIEMKDAKLILH